MIYAIILLSAAVVILSCKLIPLMIELGKLRQEREQDIVPQVQSYRGDNKRLRRDIEEILKGNQLMIEYWKERVESEKFLSKTLFESINKKP